MARKRLLQISITGGELDEMIEIYANAEDTHHDGVWFANRLAELGVLELLDYTSVDVAHGEALPPPDAHDVVFVGGSIPSINDGLDWQRTMMAWLAEYRTTGRPLFAACGGHQMVSHMHGGRVAPLPGGRFVGSKPLDLTDAGRAHFVFEGFDDAPHFHFGNEEHVERLPAGATLLASSEVFEAAAIDHGGHWVTTQFHPEMSVDGCIAAVSREVPEPHLHYRHLPDAPRLFVNFLAGTGIL